MKIGILARSLESEEERARECDAALSSGVPEVIRVFDAHPRTSIHAEICEFNVARVSACGLPWASVLPTATKTHRLKPAPLVHNRFVGFHLAVANVDDAVGPVGDIEFVSDEDDGVALAVQPREQGHDFIARF